MISKRNKFKSLDPDVDHLYGGRSHGQRSLHVKIWLQSDICFFKLCTCTDKQTKTEVTTKPRPSYGMVVAGQQFTEQNIDQLHVLISSAHETTHRDMTYTVLKAT